MLSVVSSYIWGEEEEEKENCSSREEDWVLVERPEEEKQFFVSSVAHSVPLTVPCSGPSSLSHTLTNSPANIGTSFLVHQAVAPSSKAVTTSTQTYRPRLAAFVPLFGSANVKKGKEEEDEVVVLAHYCNGQEIKIEKETFRPRSKALVPLFGNVDSGLKGQKEEEVANYCSWRGEERVKLEKEEETSKKPVDDNLEEGRKNNEEEDDDVVLLAHYYNGQYIKQEEAEGKRSMYNAANTENEQTDDEVVVLAHFYNGQRVKEEEKIEECQSYKPRHMALVPLFGGGCTGGEKRKRDEEVVVLAHYYNGQQIKQEEVDFQRFTSRNEALDFPSEDSAEEEDDEVVVVAHYYNGHQMAPLFEESLMEEKEDEVVVLAHYQNGRQVEETLPAFATFIGPLEEEKEEEVVVLAHYYNGQQIKQERRCHETFQPFIGPLEERESQRFQQNLENIIPSFENLSDPKYQKEEVEDDKEDVVVLAHYHKGQRIDRTLQPWSPARALNFSGKPLALTGPSKLALTYQEPTGIIDFLLDCLPFPEEEDEELKTRGEEEESIPLPFSPNLAHTTDVTKVSLDLLSPTHQPFPTPSLVDAKEEELGMCSYQRRRRMGKGGRRCNLPMRQFPTFRSYFS
jgi:quinolinate synthase